MVSILEELEGLFPAAASESVYEVRLDLITPDPHQPRKEFPEHELVELALSIEAHGVTNPVLLRPDADHPGRYILVTGERRFLASQRARRTSIPALIREIPAALLPILQLVENLQRAELKPLETAEALSSLLGSAEDLNQARLSMLLGKSQAWVSQHLALLAYQGLTQEALAADLLQSPETARLFEQLPPADREQLLDSARETRAPITRNAVTAAQPVHPASREPADSRKDDPKRTGRPPKEKTFPLPPLTAAQLTALFQLLDLGPLPRTQGEIWQTLLSRLTVPTQT